jgi:hypothetical protein
MQRNRRFFRFIRPPSLVAAAAIACGFAPAAAMPTVDLIDEELLAELRSYLADEVVTMSVAMHNDRYGTANAAEVERLDKQWVAERSATKKPLISATLANPLSNYLTRVQAHSLGLLTEIIVFNRNGLNVGQSNITSDFWQGDEAKYQKTFPNGADAIFIDEPEFDDDSKTWRVQVNISIADPVQRAAIGAATFEINLTELERRAAQ